MEFKIKTEIFKEALRIVQKGASVGTATPLLCCVELELREGILSLKTSNLENSVQIRMKPLESIEEGKVLINVHYLESFVSKITQEVLEIKAETTETANRLAIKYGKSRGNLNITGGELPAINTEAEVIAVLEGSKFSQGINAVAFACAKTHHRPVFTGINIIISPDTVEYIASDTFRLAYYKHENSGEKEGNIIIPAKNALEIARIFADAKEIVLKTNSKRLIVEGKGIVFTTALLDGEFPNFRNLLEEKGNNVLEVTDEIKNALERVRLLAEQKTKIPYCKVNLTSDAVTISSNSDAIGEIKEEIATKGEIKEEFIVGYNADYLLQILKKINKGEIKIPGPTSPTIIKGKESNLKCILMPTKLAS